MQKKSSESDLNSHTDASSAKLWSWTHDPDFERQTIAALHDTGKGFLPFAAVLCAGFTYLDYLSAPPEALTSLLLLRLLCVSYLVFCSVYLRLTAPGQWTVLGPQETMALLNRILSRLGPCVRNHGGFIDKYIGDAIIAFFPGSPQQALIAAQDMCMALQDSDFFGGLRGKVVIGIGIHQGAVMMGTLGEAESFEAAAIGDTVNVAAMVKSLTTRNY